MFDEDRKAGRALEIIVGLITALISLVLVALLAIWFTKAQLSGAAVVGCAILGVLLYWFGQLSYRLLFNKAKSSGGLLSPATIKFWCGLLGIGALCGCVFAIISGEFNVLLICVLNLGSCIVGWQVASKRQRRIE